MTVHQPWTSKLELMSLLPTVRMDAPSIIIQILTVIFIVQQNCSALTPPLKLMHKEIPSSVAVLWLAVRLLLPTANLDAHYGMALMVNALHIIMIAMLLAITPRLLKQT